MPRFWQNLSQATCQYHYRQYLILSFLQHLISSWEKKKSQLHLPPENTLRLLSTHFTNSIYLLQSLSQYPIFDQKE